VQAEEELARPLAITASVADDTSWGTVDPEAQEIATMGVWVNLHLFGKPGYELREGEDVTPEELRALADNMQARLREAADIVEKMTGAGWCAQMGLYDIFLSHPFMNTKVHVEEQLQNLGIDPELLWIDEMEDEEEFLEEGDMEEGDMEEGEFEGHEFEDEEGERDNSEQ
jgi:hypothetical protein